MNRAPSLLPLALAAGVAWAVGVTLIGTQADTDPVGAGYDLANRAFTVAPALLLWFALVLHRQAVGRHRLGATLLAGSAALMLAGNVLEFWGVLLSSGHTEKTAVLLGEGSAYWGSGVGWIIFLVGGPLLLAAFVVLGLAAPGGRWRRLATGATGLLASLSTALWAVSPAAAAIAGSLFALGLVGLVAALEPAPRPQDPAGGRATVSTA